MKTSRTAKLCRVVAFVLASLAVPSSRAAAAENQPRRVVFEGVKSEQKWPLKELGAGLAGRLVGLQVPRPGTQDRHAAAVLPLRLHRQRPAADHAPAAGAERLAAGVRAAPLSSRAWTSRAPIWPRPTIAAPTRSGCQSGVPFGDLKKVESLGLTMEYPLPGAAVEIRSMKLAKEDPGSDFLEGKPVLDEFGQWAHADWPRKIKSREQLEKELADEDKTLKPGDFGYWRIRRLQEHAGQGHRLLPRRTGGRQMVVRRPARPLVSVAKGRTARRGRGGGGRQQQRRRIPPPADWSGAWKPGGSTPAARG